MRSNEETVSLVMPDGLTVYFYSYMTHSQYSTTEHTKLYIPDLVGSVEDNTWAGKYTWYNRPWQRWTYDGSTQSALSAWLDDAEAACKAECKESMGYGRWTAARREEYSGSVHDPRRHRCVYQSQWTGIDAGQSHDYMHRYADIAVARMALSCMGAEEAQDIFDSCRSAYSDVYPTDAAPNAFGPREWDCLTVIMPEADGMCEVRRYRPWRPVQTETVPETDAEDLEVFGYIGA